MKEKDFKFKNILLNITISLIILPIADRLFTPMYDSILSSILSAKNTSLKFLSDFIYSRISDGVYINIPFYIFIILISFFLGFLMHNALIPYKAANSCCDVDLISTCTKRKEFSLLLKLRCFIFNSKSCKSLSLIGYISLYLIFVIFLLTTNFINLNITKITNNIEIIAPYVSDYDYKVLKSTFHSISSRKDFDTLNQLLNEHADNTGVKLK